MRALGALLRGRDTSPPGGPAGSLHERIEPTPAHPRLRRLDHAHLSPATQGRPPGLSRNGPVFGVAASPLVSACAIDDGCVPPGPPVRLVGSGQRASIQGYSLNSSVRHAEGAAVAIELSPTIFDGSRFCVQSMQVVGISLISPV